MTSETTLDELFEMQARRRQEINRKGVNFTIGLSDTERKGLVIDSNTIHFTPDTCLHPGQTVKSAQGAEYFIKSAASKAGRIEATVVAVTMHLDIYQHQDKGQHPTTKQALYAYSLAKTNIPAAYDRDQGALVVSASSAPRPLDLVKSGASTWQVKSVIFNQGVAFVNVEEYTDLLNKTAPIRIMDNGCRDSSQRPFSILIN